MSLIETSVKTIQERVGKLTDTELSEINLSRRTQDVFCNEQIIFVPDKNTYAAMFSIRALNADVVKPRMIYSPMLEKYGSPKMSRKVVAHECGHRLRFIESDILRLDILSGTGFIHTVSTVLHHNVTQIEDLRDNKDDMSRGMFLKQCGILAAASLVTIGGTYGIQAHFSKMEEQDSDFKADAIVPEYTMGQAFDELKAIYKNHADDLDAKSNRWSLLNNPLTRFASNHPKLADRYAASEINCKRFAKNSLLWAS